MTTTNGASSDELYEITIIGAGPAGLFGAFYAGLREMKVKVIDALDELGGQLATLYPEKFIYDVPGYPKVLAQDLVKHLVEQASMFKPTFVLGERVETLEKQPDGTFKLGTNKGTTHHSRVVLICAGVGAFQPKKLPQPELAQYEGKGLYYIVKEKAIFRGKRILIVGGGDSAVDWALNLKDYAKHVTLIHRRDQFRAHAASVTELLNSPVEVKLFYELKTVRGNGKVEEAVIFDNRTKEETVLPVDAVILTLGYSVDLGPIKNWGLEMEGSRYIRVNSRMETSIPGVYAAGDICAEPGVEPMNLIVEGFAQAARAVNFAYQYLHPGARAFPGHSSEKKL
ncbi:MAG: NAD(P)/FAD-dependent oxidoreductase [Thermoflexales bacterium]|nr:NAD(P)/FAD-dependent oxidoreductase [Thermoflexales bacterium]MDW8292550.1 NAD(P)/FAD-dependent oxidoreductase [Anaerolineae bacterium]